VSRIDGLKAKFWSKRTPKDFTWAELQRLLNSYGYQEKQGNGSRVKFNAQDPSLPRLNLHKPHPDPVLKQYLVNEIKETLKNAGITHE